MVKFRVAFYIHNLKQGGAESVFVQFANYLAKFNNMSIDFVVDECTGELRYALHDNITLIDLNSKNIKYSVYYLLRYLRKNKPDLVCSTLKENNFNILLARILSRQKFKIIVREANTLSEEFKREVGLVKLIKKVGIRLMYAQAQEVICLSQHMEIDLRQNVFGHVKTTIINNPVNFDLIKQKSLEYSVNLCGEHNIVVVSRLTWVKGYLELFQALQHLHDNNLNVHCTILGVGENEDEIKRYCSELDLDSFVTFVGFVPNPYPYILAADVFVQCSYFEGMPNSVLQALALEKPVVSTDAPGAIREIQQYSDLVSLVDLHDPNALANGIYKKLISASHRYNHITFYEKFSHENVCSRFYNITQITLNSA